MRLGLGSTIARRRPLLGGLVPVPEGVTEHDLLTFSNGAVNGTDPLDTSPSPEGAVFDVDDIVTLPSVAPTYLAVVAQTTVVPTGSGCLFTDGGAKYVGLFNSTATAVIDSSAGTPTIYANGVVATTRADLLTPLREGYAFVEAVGVDLNGWAQLLLNGRASNFRFEGTMCAVWTAAATPDRAAVHARAESLLAERGVSIPALP